MRIGFLYKSLTVESKYKFMKNPAPTDYEKFTADETHRSRKGFSMRPRTATSYNCKQ